MQTSFLDFSAGLWFNKNLERYSILKPLHRGKDSDMINMMEEKEFRPINERFPGGLAENQKAA